MDKSTLKQRIQMIVTKLQFIHAWFPGNAWVNALIAELNWLLANDWALQAISVASKTDWQAVSRTVLAMFLSVKDPSQLLGRLQELLKEIAPDAPVAAIASGLALPAAAE